MECSNTVFSLKCVHCSTLLTQRAKKTTLLSKIEKTIYASDFSTSNLNESVEIHDFEHCKCKIRDVFCKSCEQKVGYHVITPCFLCISEAYLPFFWIFYPESCNFEKSACYTWDNIPAFPEKQEVNLVNSAPQYLFCGICFNLIEDASILRCGHTFCRVCITRVIDLNNKCPFDNAIMNNEMVFPNYFARDAINDLLIFCKNCGQIMKLGEQNKHEKENCQK